MNLISAETSDLITLTPANSTVRHGAGSSARDAAANASGFSFLDRAIFYGAMILIVLTAIPYGTVEPWSQGLFECAVFLLSLLWVVEGLLSGSWVKGSLSLFYPIIALVILAAAQSLTLWRTDIAGTSVGFAISSDPFESWIFALRTGALVLFGLLLVRFTSTRKRLGVLVHVLIGLAVACAIFGIARQTIQRVPGFLLPRLLPASGFAQFINKNHFPFLMEMAIGLAIGLLVMRSERRERIPLYLSAVVAMGAGLFLCKSRGGLLALTSQLICSVLLFVNSRKLKPESEPGFITRSTKSLPVRVAMAAVLVLVVVSGVAWLASDQLATGVETAAVEISDNGPGDMQVGARRRDIWLTSWKIFKAHPLAGSGLGGYWAEVPAFHDANGSITPQQAHNDYLELLASGGVIGLGILAWFAVTLFKQARHSMNTTMGFQRAVNLGAVVALVGVGVHSSVDFGLHITINAAVFVALLAIISLGPLQRESRLRRSPVSPN